jgi:hypothetical protein
MFSLCIPTVDDSVSTEQIYREFYRLNLGTISNIKLIKNKIKRTKGQIITTHTVTYRAFINYKTVDENNSIYQHFQKSEDNINVFHSDGPWFWKVYKSNS